MVKEAITHPIAKDKIDTVNETDKPKACKSKKINQSEKNNTKLDHWINQGHCINKGLLKELKNNTQ